MALKAPNLDDLRFQSDLVDEARKRIIHYCPEWTEYNLSDPGITMIELFAWMTEMMCYRLNRVPERNYIKFLDMLGFEPEPAKPAQTAITFWLSALLPLSENDDTTVIVPEGTEVQCSDVEEPIIFSTNRELEIKKPLLSQLRTEERFNSNFVSRLGLEIFYPFNRLLPKEGDTFYIGFDEENNISGHILQLDFTCMPTEAVGIRREDPPWVWECLTSEGWEPIRLGTTKEEKDTTGGLNNETGHVTLYLPLSFSPQQLNGLQSFWIRCRIEQKHETQGMYAESPRITGLKAYAVGAQVPASNARHVNEEYIGVSTGEPNQSFKLNYAPVLNFSGNETVEVEEDFEGRTVFRKWERVEDFASSGQFDRHYILDNSDGTIQFGPSVRQPDGTVIQYGKIPESGRRIRVTEYRYGGGVNGNLPENSINMMNTSLAYIFRASNLERSTGGRDAESLEELIYRSRRELQAQQRAVTAEDFEQFTLNSTRRIARACCLSPEQSGSGSVNILIVPDVYDSLRNGDLYALHVSDDLRAEVRSYLDQYRLLTTALNIEEPKYYGIKVSAKIVPQDFAKQEEVLMEVNEMLKDYLSPVGSGGESKGWKFGQSFFNAEVIARIQRIPTVKYVLDAEISWRRVTPINENDADLLLEETDLEKVDKMLMLPADGLICSLRHDIKLTTLEDYTKEGKAAS